MNSLFSQIASRGGTGRRNAFQSASIYDREKGRERVLSNFEHHIFVCNNQREPGSARGCCAPEGKSELHGRLKDLVAEAGLKARVRANKAGCLDQCEHGPVIVVYPEQVWYGGVGVDDLEEIVREHIVGGRPVERLRLPDACVNTAACPHKPRPRTVLSGASMECQPASINML